jgi:predicted nucleic acid-binding protein
MNSTILASITSQAVEFDRPIVVDSSAFIAYLGDEPPTASLVASIIDNGELQVIVPAIVLSEALVRVVAEYGQDGVERTLKSIDRILSVEIVGFDREQAIEAARIRAQTRLKLPDAAIIATARVAGALAIVGNDRTWQTRPLGIQYIHLDDVVREAQMEQEPR